MAKTKHEETINLYCETCKHRGTDICKNCTEVFNEETQQYLMPTKYVRNEEEPKMPCTMCEYYLVNALDDPCRECIEHASRISSTGERVYENFVPKREGLGAGNKKDNVNHPSHYELTSIECIQAMTLIFGEDAVADFCACNAFKYMWRYKHKNGMEDLKKAEQYLSYLGKIQEDNEFNSGSFDPEISNRLVSLLEELMKTEQ